MSALTEKESFMHKGTSGRSLHVEKFDNGTAYGLPLLKARNYFFARTAHNTQSPPFLRAGKERLCGDGKPKEDLTEKEDLMQGTSGSSRLVGNYELLRQHCAYFSFDNFLKVIKALWLGSPHTCRVLFTEPKSNFARTEVSLEKIKLR